MKHATGSSLLLATTIFLGCGARPFVRADPPATASNVTVALTVAENPVYDLLDLTLVLRVTNASAALVAVIPGNMRLLARDNLPSTHLEEPDPQAIPTKVPPQSFIDISVRFRRAGDAKCNQEMSVFLDHAMEQAGRELAFRPISFVPENSDT